MSIPQVPAFERLLSSLVVFPPDNTNCFERITAVPASFAIDVNGQVEVPERAIWFNSTEAISMDALVVKVEKELIARNHKSNRQIALAILALYALRRRPEEGGVVAINRFLDWVVEAQVSQTFVFPPAQPPQFALQLGPFHIQVLELPRLKYRCQKAGSDFFDRYKHELRGRLSIDRDLFPVVVINWHQDIDDARERLVPKREVREAYGSFMDFYFETISRELQSDFWSTLLDAQHLLIAAGAPYVDERILSRLTSSQMIAIFSGIGPEKVGFVLPLTLGHLNLDLAKADVRVPAVVQLLKNNYGFSGFVASEVHYTLRAYSTFVSKAERHISDGRVNEGFLHSVIALDLVFGEKDASTKSVSKRVACITHRAMGRGFDEQVKRLNMIYDRRSRYVHAGETVAEAAVDDVRAVCKEVLWCLLRLQKGQGQTAPVSTWLATLDYLVAATEAQRPIDDKELRECGIAPEQ